MFQDKKRPHGGGEFFFCPPPPLVCAKAINSRLAQNAGFNSNFLKRFSNQRFVVQKRPCSFHPELEQCDFLQIGHVSHPAATRLEGLEKVHNVAYHAAPCRFGLLSPEEQAPRTQGSHKRSQRPIPHNMATL